jgi:adenylylsulfate kinase-like enzyme
MHERSETSCMLTRTEKVSREENYSGFTGLSGAGKTTICAHLANELRSRGSPTQVLHGDDRPVG